MFASISLPTDLAASELLSWDMAKQIIQSQHSLAMYGITAVVAVAAGLMFASWLWNVFLRRHELKTEIESLKSEITIKLKDDFVKLTKQFDDQVVKMREEIEKKVEKRMILFDAEKARLFGLANLQLKDWENMAVWMGIAIIGYAKVGEEKLLRVSVDGLNQSLDKCKKLEDDGRERIKKGLSSIPGTLREERKQIEDKLKKLPKEITKQSEIKPN